MIRTPGTIRGTASWKSSRAAVSIIFATAIIPMAMTVGLAIDYSYYSEAKAQLNLAADAAAIHAVRIASTDFINGRSSTAAGTDGAAAGQQWFAAQAGLLPDGAVNTVTIAPVAYNAGSSTFTATVSYAGTISTHFGGLFHIAAWNIGGTASAVITVNSYVEIAMLLDNSSSMLIGATPSDVEALQNLTVCPPTVISSATGHNGGTSEYSWSYGSGLTFGSNKTSSAAAVTPNPPKLSTPSSQWGSCDSLFTGPSGECVYPPSLPGLTGISSPIDANGYCPVNTGTPTSVTNPKTNLPYVDSLTGQTANLPAAPCGFACHSNNTPNDYYTLMQAANLKGANITLRFDVVQQAAAQVVNTLIAKETQSQAPNQFSLGVFTFNSAINQVHPSPGNSFVEADNQLATGLAHIQAIAAPAVADQPNTDFPDAMTYLAANVKAAGDGTTPQTPRKNLFIVTDGLEDYSPNNRFIGQMTSPLNETTCAPLKALGFSIYVLYTPYYALPNPFYLSQSNSRAAVEAPITNTSLSIAAGLQACASNTSQYYQATDAADINTALQAMLLSALSTPGRISQ